MRKALLPMIAALALCGTATAALIATTAHADQTPRKPVMVAMTTNAELGDTAAPAPEGGAGDMMRGPDRAARHAQMCKDMVASKIGELAFLEAKLSLTPGQAPLFARWKSVMLDTARQHADDCTAHEKAKHTAMPSMLDRMAMEEKMLKMRLSDIEAQRPALEALYNALTPTQKQEFGRAEMHRMHMMMGMMDRGHGPEMDHGRMGPMGNGAMDDGPPPGPPPAP